MVWVGAIGGRDEYTGIDDQHGLIAAETVTQNLFDSAGNTTRGGTSADER